MLAQRRPAEIADAEAVGEGVWRVTGGAFPSNAYVCAQGGSDAFIVDPGLDPQRIDGVVRDLGLTPRQVFCTHGHFDHIGGASYFQAAYGCEVYLHAADLKTMKSGNFLLMLLKLEQRIALPDVTPVASGDAVPSAGGGAVAFASVPGHTPGSCFLSHGQALFTGDTLYAQGVGLSKLPGENHDLLRSSLLSVWDAMPGERMVHPGHGRSARFADIRRTNRALRAFLGLSKEGAPE